MKKSTKVALSIVVSTVLFTGCVGGDSSGDRSYGDEIPDKSSKAEKNSKAKQISFLTPLDIEVPEGEEVVTQLIAESSIDAEPITFSFTNYYYSDNSRFTIDRYNKLRFKDTTDFENPADDYKSSNSSNDNEKQYDNTYKVVLSIKDAQGHTIEKTLHIKVTNVPDVKPTITNTKLTISGTVLANSVVGNVIVNKGDSEITQMTLSGADANLFTIDKDGVIKTATTIPVDKKSISLKVKATSPAGVSDEKDVTIYVNDTDPSVRGVAQLGLERNATVKIFKINNDGTYTKLFTETTSGGGIESAGRFDTHSDELEDKAYYIYQVTDGEDIDANNDGVEDENATKTKGAMRAIVLGEWLKKMDNDVLKITALSEMLYIKSIDDIKNNFFDLKSTLNSQAQTILALDINNDGNINAKDILSFDPLIDKDALKEEWKEKFDKIVDDIHNGKDGYGVNPKLIGSIESKYAYGVTLSSDGTKAYVADLKEGLKIIDITTPKTPKLLGTINLNEAKDVTLSSDGTKAYVVDYASGLKIIDITTPKTPKLLGSINTDYAQSVAISLDGTKAYVADDYSGLKIIDITTPKTPKLLGSIKTYKAQDITISSDGTKAYVADYSRGLKIIDITIPESPTLLDFIDTDDEAQGITLSSDSTKAYVADYDAGLKIIDITTPESSTLLGSIDTDYAQDVTLSSDGTKAYVADCYSGLKIIDITTPESPALLGSINTKYAQDVTLSSDGTKAYVADNDGGLKIIDIGTDSVAPLE